MQRDLLNVYLNFNAVNGDKLVSSVKSTFEQINTVVKNYTPAFPLNMDVKQIDKQLKVVTDEIMDYFPQSPAKKGALRGLENAGSEIIGQLMLGMNSSTYKLYKSVEYIASQILEPFKKFKDEFTEALSFNVDMKTYERFKYLETMFNIDKDKLADAEKRLKNLDYLQEKNAIKQIGGIGVENAFSYALRRADRKNSIDDIRILTGLPNDILNNLKYIRKDIREIITKQLDNLNQPFSNDVYSKIVNIETLFKSLTYSSASLKDRLIIEGANWLFPNIEDFLSGLVGYDVKIENILKNLSEFLQQIFEKISHFFKNDLKNFSLKSLFSGLFGDTKTEIKTEIQKLSEEFQWKISNEPEQRLNTGLNVTATKAIAYYGKKILESNGKNIYSLKDLNNEIKQYLENELNYLRKYDKASDTIPLLEHALQRIDKTFTNKELQKLFLKNKAPELAESALDKGFSLKNATASSLKSLSDYEAEYIDSELKKYEAEINRRKWERGSDYETEYYKRETERYLEREREKKNIKNSDISILGSIESIQNDKGFLENIFDNVYNKIAERLYYFANYVKQKIDSSPFLKKLDNLITYFYNEFIQKPLDYAKKTKQNGFLSVFFNFMRIFWDGLKQGFDNILDEENGWLGRIVKYFRDKFNAFKKFLGFEEKNDASGGSGGGANTETNGLDVEKTKEQAYNLSTATAGNEVVNDTGGYVWEFTEKAQGFLDSVWLFLDDVYTSIQSFINGIINQITTSKWYNQLIDNMKLAFDYFLKGDIRAAIFQAGQGLLNVFEMAVLPTIEMIYSFILPYVQKTINTAFDMIIKAINAVREPLFNLIKAVSELIFGILLHAVLHPLMRELQDLGFKLLNHAFVKIKELLENVLFILFDSVLNGLKKLINIVLFDLWISIFDGLREVHNKIVDLFTKTIIPYVTGIGSIIYNSIIPFLKNLKDKISKYITDKIEEIKNKVYNIIKKLKFWESEDSNIESSGAGSSSLSDEESTVEEKIDKLAETTEDIKDINEQNKKTQEKQLDEQKEQNKNNQKQAENQEETNALLKKQLEDKGNNGISGVFAKYFSGAYNIASTSENSKLPPLPTLEEAKDFLKSFIPGDLFSGLFGGSGSANTTATNSNDETSQGSNKSTDDSLLEKAYETIKQYTNTDEIAKITNKIDNLVAISNDYPGIIEEFGVNTNQVLKEFIGKLSKLEPNKENLKILLNNSQDELINEFYGEIQAKYTQTNLDKVLEQWRSKFDEIKQYGLEIPQELVDKASESIYSSIGTDALEKGFEFIREKIKAFEEECQIKIPIQLPIKEVGTAVSNMEQLMGNLYKLSGEQSKEFYTAQKAMSIISATISTYEAATKALNTGVYPMNLVNAGIVTAAGLANVALIASQSFSSGGQVQGKNTGKDDVPAMLMAGEYVIKKKAVDYLGLDYLNNLNNLTPQSTSSSSDVAPAFVAQSQENQVRQPINNEISIVNYTDIKQFSQFLNTEEGKKSIVNIVAEKSSQLRSFFR